MGAARVTATGTLAVAEAALAALNAYLLVVLAAAAAPRTPSAQTGERLRFMVLVPAHDEEDLLPGALESIARQDYPRELVGVVVVADNCSDRTPDVARAAGVEVLERTDGAPNGKGSALAWALSRLPRDYDALAVLDADCAISENFLAAASRRLSAAAAVQSDCIVENADASATAALRAAAYALLVRVRMRGKDRLGWSCGLLGTGMAFRREVVERHSWDGELLDDGLDYHLRLVEGGVSVRYMGEASVNTAMPVSAAASGAQQLRWEAGKVQGVRHWLPRLVRRGIRERDAASLQAALDLAVPSQSILAALNASTLAAALALRSRRLAALGLANVAAQSLFVVGGLRVADASPAAYRGLISAPALVARKLGLYGRLLGGEKPGWQRGHRA